MGILSSLKSFLQGDKGGAKAVDPVCKMQVDTSNPPGGTSEYQGATYYFCAPGCKTNFDAEPQKYLAG